MESCIGEGIVERILSKVLCCDRRDHARVDECLIVKDMDLKVFANVIGRIPDVCRNGKILTYGRFIVAEKDAIGKNGNVEEIGGDQWLGILYHDSRASGRIKRLEPRLPVSIIGQA